MSKRTLIAFIIILSLLFNFGLHETLVQAQIPPPIPPHGIWGEASVYDTQLLEGNNDYTIYVRMERLLIIFLHVFDDQGTIAAIVTDLGSNGIAELQQAFSDSDYCQSRTPPTVLSPTATVTVQAAGDEWEVTDGANKYTVIREDISVWNPVSENWEPGEKLEVKEHNGVITSYTMGYLTVNYYVVQIPKNSAEILWGDIGGGDTYVLREPGTAVVGDKANMWIKRDNEAAIPVTEPAGPYTVTDDAFIYMDINADAIPIDYSFDFGFNIFAIPVTLDNCSLDVVLALIIDEIETVQVQRMVGGTPTWKIYAPGALDQIGCFQPGEGYVITIKDQGGAGFTIIKPALTQTEVAVRAGFNLVAYNYTVEKSINEIFPPDVRQHIETIQLRRNGTWLICAVGGGDWVLTQFTTIRPGEAMVITAINPTTIP